MPIAKKKKSSIDLNMTFGEILSQNPDSADVMLSYGLHCVGCGINEYDTIQQGAAIHGLSKEDMKSLLEDLKNVTAPPPVQTQKGISITAQAIRKIKELQLLEEKPGWPLSVSFLTQPNDEREFFLEFVPEPGKKQVVLPFGTVVLLFAPEDVMDLKGLMIDYQNTDEGEGFLFRQTEKKKRKKKV